MSQPDEIYEGFTCHFHRLRHGPGGCPRCREDEAQALRAEAMRVRKLSAGALILFLAGTAAYVAWPRHPPDLRLDPREYRPALETLESVLYGSFGAERPEADDRETLSQSVRALEFALTTARASEGQRRALAAIVPFTSRVSDLAASRAQLDLPALREEWEKLRAAHFRPAPWLRTTAAVRLGHEAEARGVPTDAARYTKALGTLRGAADRADAVLGRLPQASEGSAPDPAFLKEWTTARDEVRKALDHAKEEFPADPVGRHWTWKQAYRDLDRLQVVIEIALIDDRRQATGLPDAAEGQFRSAEMRRALDAAQRSLDAAIR